ncbi:MAG TPA: hypothetical protein VNI54_07440 [Thermoanaerobaculia bacterium]|nr:hypothetical protein [Thermoanaerobaculia bacterium]
MLQRAFIIGGVVLVARLATLPRTAWDPREPEPFLAFAAFTILLSVVAAVVIALREPVAAVLFSFSAAMLVHGVSATLPYVGIAEELGLPHELNVARFTLHPWGSKIVFLPVLVAIAFGVPRVMKRRELEPLAWFTFAWLAIGIGVIDPRDGVRFAIPSLIFVSIVAAEGLKALRVPWIGACAIAALSIFYTWPLLRERVAGPSPLAQARRAQEPAVFSRSDADAWGKLTSVPQHVARVKKPEFTPGVGVYGPEQGWRWVKKYAELSDTRRLTLHLPPDAKLELNDLRVNGTPLRVRRGESVIVNAGPRVVIEAASAFPLDPPDTRTVAVQIR